MSSDESAVSTHDRVAGISVDAFSILALASAVFPRTADPVRSAVEVPISLRVRCREACLTILLTTYSAVVSRGGVIRARIAHCRYLKYGGMPQSVNAELCMM